MRLQAAPGGGGGARAGTARPQGGQVFMLDADTGQLVPQGQAEDAQGEGGEKGRKRKGSSQRARDVVREAVHKVEELEEKLEAELSLWQARKLTLSTKTATEG